MSTETPGKQGCLPQTMIAGGTARISVHTWRLCTQVMLMPPLGLSPRLRGNQVIVGILGVSVGSIPAPAGEPAGGTTGGNGGKVYPRACGGTAFQTLHSAEDWGLSPRLRGNRNTNHVLSKRLGSIPAPAGEPFALRLGDNDLGVYPRACGGTLESGEMAWFQEGLSPRLRGNRASAFIDRLQNGSIPAPAGEPVEVLSLHDRLTVYPRACGGTILKYRPSIR